MNEHASHTFYLCVSLPEITGEKLHFAKYLLHSDRHIDDKLPLEILTGISSQHHRLSRHCLNSILISSNQKLIAPIQEKHIDEPNQEDP
jgi:hypothetical protein